MPGVGKGEANPLSASEKKKGKSKGPLLLAAAALLLAGGAGLWYYLSQIRGADPLEGYRTAIAENGDVSRTITGEGSVEERETLALFVRSAQKVASIPVKEWDTVTEGQVLVVYDIQEDRAELERQLTEARLYLQNARLSLENIARAPAGNTLLSYESEVTAAQKAVDDARLELQSLESQIAQQRLRTENLRRVSEAYRDDYEDDIITKSDYDTARTNYRVAEAALEELYTQEEAAQQTLALRERQLEDANKKLQNAQDPLSDPATASRYQIQQNLVEIHQLTVSRLEEDLEKLTEATVSPIDGFVTAITAQEGGTVSAYTPVVELADLAKPVIRFEAGEYDAPQIALGQKALVAFGGLEERFAGRVTKLGARAVKKEDSGDDEVVVPVEITLEDADDRLKVGYSVDIEIVMEERSQVVSVPIRALLQENGGYQLLVVEDGLPVRREVAIGLYGDRSVEITQGLAQGETYILNPLEGQ